MGAVFYMQYQELAETYVGAEARPLRDGGLARLRTAFDDVVSGNGRVALVTGPAQSRRSSLVDRLVEELSLRGAGVLRGGCREQAAHTALAPWSEALSTGRPAIRAQHWQQLCGGRSADGGHRRLSLDLPKQAAARFQLFDRVAATLHNAARRNPLMLALDDVHAADGASLQMLRFLVRRLHETPLFLVATYTSTPAGMDSVLHTTIAEVLRHPNSLRVELEDPLQTHRAGTLRSGLDAAPISPLCGRPAHAGSRIDCVSHPGGVDSHVFRRQGDFWTICYEGRPSLMSDGKGLRYLAHLLAHPGQDVLSLALMNDATKTRRETGLADNWWLDAAVRGAYVRRMDDLRQVILEAEHLNDRDRALQARVRLDMLAGELCRAVGLQDDSRCMGTALERARSAVRKRISAAIERLHVADSGLGVHLRGTVSTGYFCSYRPPRDAKIDWHL